MIGAAVSALLENARVGARALDENTFRRDTTRELERQVQRALWRAERRGRKLPLQVRQGASWINSQRRVIAWELFRALRSLGASAELARVIAAQACERFPRDGVVIADADPRKPRENGTSQRHRATNPRARGASPRQVGTSPRQRRAAADLGTLQSSPPAVVQLEQLQELQAPASTPYESPRLSIEELAPGWNNLKSQLLGSLSTEERIRAKNAAANERERLDRVNRRSNHPPPTTDTRS